MNLTSEEIAGLQSAVDEFGEQVTHLKLKRIRMMRILIVSVTIDILLTLGLGVVAYNENHNGQTVKSNTETIKSVQCSLYQLVLSAGYHPEKHTEDLAAYKVGYETIQRDSKRLGCPQITTQTTQPKGTR